MTDLLSVSEAATLAGVSVRTMRRWVTSGQVRTVGNGHRRQVVADSLSGVAATNGQNGHGKRSSDRTQTATSDTETDVTVQADRLADLVRELSERLADQTAMTALWMERARILTEQLALQAPQPENGTLGASTATQPSDPSTEPSAPAGAPDASTADRPIPAPWWRRWLLAVYG
jgi:Helix-turn-helix domain